MGLPGLESSSSCYAVVNPPDDAEQFSHPDSAGLSRYLVALYELKLVSAPCASACKELLDAPWVEAPFGGTWSSKKGGRSVSEPVRIVRL